MYLLSNDTLPPECVETYLPVQFKDAHTFLGKSRDEAVKDYNEQLDSHVSEELRTSIGILDLLNRHSLNVPDEWSGIKGIEPLKLKWKDTLPERMKPKARPINPKLWKAFERVSQIVRLFLWLEQISMRVVSCSGS